jgi:hypothetical protein
MARGLQSAGGVSQIHSESRARHRVAVLQSNYLPWKGYFDIIGQVDTFIFYDDLQYTKNDWRNRNRIKTQDGVRWLTIPCGGDLRRRICDVRIDGIDWQPDHWRRIESNYHAAPYWSLYAESFRAFYQESRWTHLSDLNQALIKFIATDVLKLSATFDDSRRFGLTAARTRRLVDLLIEAGATDYVSGPAAKAYIEPGMFEEAGIALHYVSYDGYPEYPQLHGPFVHDVSIIDLLFNTGPDARSFLRRGYF